jgi:hypothetical protein
MDESTYQANKAEDPSDLARRYREVVYRELEAIRCELDADKQTIASSTKAITRSRATLDRCTAWPRSLGEPD